MGFLGKSKKETGNVAKCMKCKKRAATGEDGLCDSCRFSEILTKISKERQREQIYSK